jgi:hypothetical protein
VGRTGFRRGDRYAANSAGIAAVLARDPEKAQIFNKYAASQLHYMGR